MSERDLLVVAGDAAELLEQHGLVACGRRIDGLARVDFWTRDGQSHTFALRDVDMTVEDVVDACLASIGEAPSSRVGIVHQFDTKN